MNHCDNNTPGPASAVRRQSYPHRGRSLGSLESCSPGLCDYDEEKR